MSNFASRDVVQKLDLLQRDANFSVLGIGRVSSNITSSCQIELSSLCKNFKTKIDCLIIPNITGLLPGVQIDLSSIKIPSHIQGVP